MTANTLTQAHGRRLHGVRTPGRGLRPKPVELSDEQKELFVLKARVFFNEHPEATLEEFLKRKGVQLESLAEACTIHGAIPCPNGTMDANRQYLVEQYGEKEAGEYAKVLFGQ